MLVSVQSLGLRIPGHDADLVGRHEVLGSGQIRVELPTHTCMARHLVHDGHQMAVIEVIDLAPISVRDRIRARGTLSGLLTPAGVGTDVDEMFAIFDFLSAELVVNGHSQPVAPDSFAAAQPDPLASVEASLLCHLNDHHQPAVKLLTRLIPTQELYGVEVVRLLRLDRFGVVLRLEFTGQDRDIGLNFHTPLDHRHELNAAMEALLARARHAQQGTADQPCN
jgi:hypothetical protein